MQYKRPVSHFILIAIFLVILIIGLFYSYKLSYLIKDMATVVATNMKNTMDPRAPDPGKTESESLTLPSSSKKVYIGTYLDRIEDLNIKESSWSYEFYLWFKWKPNEIDLLGKKIFLVRMNCLLPSLMVIS
jgi:hypothetical protein